MPDPELELLSPADDVHAPELSIVVPALNERLTIETFVDWCKQGLAKAGIAGEILIVDSSTDETPALALARGARVLRTPQRGLGRAYIDAIPYIRGRYVLMGDADCTYDFREISGFVDRFRAGDAFIMGSRFKGYIEPDSMPPLHRYFGTPLTTAILNILYSTRFSDIHCGMRGITREALVRIDLQSQSWEYASEMILKAVRLRLKTTEVPVRFLKDPPGRLSHMKRRGWTEPWRAGLVNLRAMVQHGADIFLLRPGLLLLALGVLLMLPQRLSLTWALVGLNLAVVGLESFYLGCLAEVIYVYSRRWLRMFAFNRAMLVCALSCLVGAALAIPMAREYARMGRMLSPTGAPPHLAVIGAFLLIAGFLTFGTTLVVNAAAARLRPPVAP